MKKWKWIGGIALVCLIPAFIESRYTQSSTQAAQTRSVELGEVGMIDDGTSVVILSVDKDGYDDVSRRMLAGDKIGLRNLIISGKAFVVKQGTPAEVIDTSSTLRRVRIEADDRAVDVAGWLPFEDLK